MRGILLFFIKYIYMCPNLLIKLNSKSNFSISRLHSMRFSNNFNPTNILNICFKTSF